MTKAQLSTLNLNQRVSLRRFNSSFEEETLFGYVTKLYNGNHQVQVWFDYEPKPIVVGYSQIELAA